MTGVRAFWSCVWLIFRVFVIEAIFGFHYSLQHGGISEPVSSCVLRIATASSTGGTEEDRVGSTERIMQRIVSKTGFAPTHSCRAVLSVVYSRVPLETRLLSTDRDRSQQGAMNMSREWTWNYVEYDRFAFDEFHRGRRRQLYYNKHTNRLSAKQHVSERGKSDA